MRVRFPTLVVLLSIAISACASAPPQACTSADAKPGAALTCAVPSFAGRSYDICLPEDYAPARPVPVVLAIHGGGGNSRAAARTSCPGGEVDSPDCLHAMAAREGVAVVYPNWRLTRQDNIVAQALLEKAIAIDPGYGQALGVLAASHMFCTHMGWVDVETTVPVARHAALAAIQVDCEDAWPHYGLACAHLFDRRFADSLAESELALRLSPNFSPARGYYGLALSYSGRWMEANDAAQRALRLSPRDPFSQVYAGIGGFA